MGARQVSASDAIDGHMYVPGRLATQLPCVVLLTGIRAARSDRHVRARLLFLILALGTATRARATTANDLCVPGADPCIVPQGKTIAVTNGSVIDLDGRALVLAAGSGTRLDAGTGDMT